MTAGMTAAVVEELCWAPVPVWARRDRDGSAVARRAAEVTALLRWTGRFSITAGRVRLEAELDHGLAAVRLRGQLEALSGHTCRVHLTALGAGRMRVQVHGAVEAVLRQLGLLDVRGRLVGGLPPMLVGNPDPQVAAAVWRGAFLARGQLAEPGRAAQVRVWCPGPAPALALAGTARRLGVTAHCRPITDNTGGGSEMVVVSGEAAVTALLSLIGAPAAAAAWRRHRGGLPARARSVGPAAFDRENQRRSAAAAAAAAARAGRALAILGAHAPPLLVAAGRLRVAHPDAGLEQLGRLADPPLSKDAIAGRLRRLLRLGDSRAAALGIPDTTHPGSTLPGSSPPDAAQP